MQRIKIEDNRNIPSVIVDSTYETCYVATFIWADDQRL